MMFEVAVVVATGLGALAAVGSYVIKRTLEKRERSGAHVLSDRVRASLKHSAAEARIYEALVRTIADLEEMEDRGANVEQMRTIAEHLATLEALESEISSFKASYVRRLGSARSQSELFPTEAVGPNPAASPR